MFIKLTEEQVKNKVKFIHDYVDKDKNAATSSKLDANANVHVKNVATLQAELYKDFNIQIKRHMVREIIEKEFGSKLKEQFDSDLSDHLIYIHDETGTIGAPYCAAVKLDPLVSSGLQSMGGESKGPKHLRSFAGSYVNTLFALSSQFNGAVATTSVLAYIDLFARRDFGDDYLETNREDIEQELQHIIYALNQPAAARGFQSVFFNWSILDKSYFLGLYENYVTPDGEKFNWESLDKLQRFFLNWFNKERLKATLTFPVVTASLLTADGEVVDTEYKSLLAKELSEGNSFFTYMDDDVTSLSSCCRLRSAVNTFNFTIGNIGDDTGSTQVITININRMYQKYVNSPADVIKIISRVQKYLVAYRKLHMFFLDNDMLDAYSAGYVTMKKQYVTLGLNGVLEAAEYLKIAPKDGSNMEPYTEWLKALLGMFTQQNTLAKEEYGILFNSEFVPAEGLGPKFYDWDKRDGLVVNPQRNAYNSYFYPVEGDAFNVLDKLELYKKDVTKHCDGGSAAHINLDEHLSSAGYERIFDVMARKGVPYVGFNVPTTVCNDCGHRDKRFVKECPKCGSENLDWETRIIGYLKRVSSFSEARQIEASNRHYHKK